MVEELDEICHWRLHDEPDQDSGHADYSRHVYSKLKCGDKERGYNPYNETTTLSIPFHHIYGFLLLNEALYQGTTGVIMKKFQPKLLLETIQKKKPKVLHIVTPMLVFFLQDSLVESYDLTSVEVVVVEGPPYVQEVLKAFLDKFSHVRYLIPVYGWAECGIAFMSSMKQRYQSTATILPSFQQKIVSQKNGEAVGFLEEGEICLRSPTIMKGYLNNAEETAKVVDAEGWFHTGDIGILERNGQTTFIEQIEEPIHFKGRLVVPSELERVLRSHKNILDSAIVGVADNNTEERPRAYVVTNDIRLSESDVKKFISGTNYLKHSAGANIA
ncbi:hypothetical protein TELCIR_06759 [Teladorsagia circumcincta]|uniref:AMP-dependent synthetase/ligase domain-containing protein n=1 Tax=Teladorsagia circumcincta TaxID=45464 RepID=A0A2G9UM57_TELCI|nr:hypothetical protein TELCIR_06759 [Teladorsagia circumcincta]